MAELAISIAISYLTARLTEPKPPRLTSLKGFNADYGAEIPLLLGPETRTDQITVIWATAIKETVHKHKPAMDYLFGLAGALLPARKSYTYSIDFAVLLAGNRIQRVVRCWGNKKVIFDDDAQSSPPVVTTGAGGLPTCLSYGSANGTHSIFSTMRAYLGAPDQEPDPTMEAHEGVGNVPRYKNRALVVFDEFQLADFNNGVPYELEFLVEEADTGDLRRIVGVLIARAGVDPNTVSTHPLRGNVRGLLVAGSKTVAESFQDLMLGFNFDASDAGGSLRFLPRGRSPRSAVSRRHLGAYEEGTDRPEVIKWVRAREVGLPQEVTVTFFDPERDYQPNVATSRSYGGSSENNIALTTGLTMTPDESQVVADTQLWRAWARRAQGFTSVDNRRDDINAGEVHAFETPTGMDSFLVVNRRLGANQVIELELELDPAPLYSDALPGIPAGLPIPQVQVPGPLNDPIFIEPPDTLTGGDPAVLIALSGSLAAGGVDPNWPGVYVWVSTDDVDFRQAGFVDAPAYMGELTAALAAYGGANPDVANTLSVDLSESGGVLESVPAADAAAALNLAYVGGEFVSIQDATGTGPSEYDATTLWRGLFGTTAGLHAIGARFAVVDQALFRFAIPPAYVGETLYFKFPQPNQALADVPSWPYTSAGTGFGGGAGGTPTTPTGLTAAAGVEGVRLTWDANPVTDNVTDYEVWRAPGLGAAFGSATLIANVGTSLTYTDTGLAPSTGYTYFIRAANLVGPSSAAAGEDATTSDLSTSAYGFAFGPKSLATMVVSEAFAFFDTPAAWEIPVGMTNSQGTIGGAGAAAPSAQTDFDIQVAGVSVGTMRFAAGQLTATFIMASASPVALGAVVSIVAPANLNGMAGFLFGSIAGTRT